MENFKLLVRPFKQPTWSGKTNRNVYCRIEYKDGRLTINGKDGMGSWGQIDMHLRKADRTDWKYQDGWYKDKVDKFFEIWEKWHLNDLRATCIHQEERGETWATHPSAVCPDCGWKLGHGWQKREVPEEVLQWLSRLPESDYNPRTFRR